MSQYGIQPSLIDAPSQSVKTLTTITNAVQTVPQPLSVSGYVSTTYSCSIPAVSPTASLSGAAAINLIAALLPAGATGASNTANISVERIRISYAWGTGGAGKPTVEFRVATCSGFVAGTAQNILAHNRADSASTMQVLSAPTSIGKTAWIPFSVFESLQATSVSKTTVLHRAELPDGKPITLRNGQPEGLYVYIFNVAGGTWPTDLAVTVDFTWTER